MSYCNELRHFEQETAHVTRAIDLKAIHNGKSIILERLLKNT